MDEFVERLNSYRVGEIGAAELVTAIGQASQALTQHESDVANMLDGVPEFLIAHDRDLWTGTLSEIKHHLKELQETSTKPEGFETHAEPIPDLFGQLSLHALLLRESAWAARGPSFHGGVNELLHLLVRALESGEEEWFQVLQLKLEAEFARLESQAELYQNLPEFAAQGMDELLPEYQSILEELSRLEELEDEAVDELLNRLEDWGIQYSAYDLDFVSKCYSRAPTPIPAVNLVLNSQLLLVDGLIVEDMVEHFIEQACETLESASTFFFEQPDLSEVDRSAYQESLNLLLEGLQKLPELEDRDQLRAFGGELINHSARLLQIQARAEGESGSRLDYKADV